MHRHGDSFVVRPGRPRSAPDGAVEHPRSVRMLSSPRSARKAAEAAAIQSLIWEQTADAQGQAGREADTFAGAMGKLKATTANVTAATAAGQVMLRLMNSGSGNDVFLGKYVESSSFIQKL